MIGNQLKDSIVPDQINAVIGWRTWRVRDKKLCSVIQKHFWQPHKFVNANIPLMPIVLPEHIAEHLADDQPVPGLFPLISHGIYAWKTRMQVKTYSPGFRAISGEVISGEVYLWGRVFEHELGYRAEFAYPKSFLVRGPFSYLRAKKLMGIYGVKELTYTYPFQGLIREIIAQPKSIPKLLLTNWFRIWFPCWLTYLFYQYRHLVGL